MKSIKKMILGATCVLGGLMLVQILLFIGSTPNPGGSLNIFGNIVLWAGIITSVIGLVLCLFNLRDDDDEEDIDDEDENNE